jgi:hypothetical protein
MELHDFDDAAAVRGFVGAVDAAYVGTYRVGSPISVREYSPGKIPDPAKNQGLAHVLYIPDTISLPVFRERLTGGWLDDATPPNTIEKTEWLVRSDLMSEQGKAALLADRRITVDWDTLKGVSWTLRHSRNAVDSDFI